jgi:phospholipid/cholesterol/gamma-HCH transport system substrate-binding protein
MEQASSKLEYKVGAFVGLGLILLMGMILALGGNKVAFTRYQRMVSYFEEVQGLFPGSVVSLAGLPVGNVKAIRFVPGQDKLAVEMEIDRQFGPRLVEGTTADVRTQGALGDKYIYLAPGPAGAKPLADGAAIPFSESGDILKMLTSKEDGVGQALGLVKELRALVASLNANNRAPGMLDGANAAIFQLKSTLTELDALIRQVRGELPNDHKLREAIASISSVLEKIDQGKGTLGALVNDPFVHQRLKAILGGSQRNAYLKDIMRETIQQSEEGKK